MPLPDPGHALRCAGRLAAASFWRRMPLRWRVAADFRRIFGRALPFGAPRTLNEKLNVLKISPGVERLARYADKLDVRSYVSGVLGPGALVPLLGSWRSPGEIDFGALPGAFVLKCNHGSGQNLVVRDKSSLDPRRTRRLLRSWLRENHFAVSCERVYRPIEPRLLAEALLEGPDGAVPPDYKVHCFRGHALFVQVDLDRETDHRRNFYSPDWRQLPFIWSEPAPDGSPLWPPGPPVPRPALLPELLRAARALSAPFPYVRADFYLLPGGLRFGELTFFHGSGLEPFWPPEIDLRLGRLLPDP